MSVRRVRRRRGGGLVATARRLFAEQGYFATSTTEIVRFAGVGTRGDLLYLWRRAARDNELMREASGVMADRHWPPLR